MAHACLVAALALLVSALLALTPSRSRAAFPGAPGPIAFQSTRAGGLSIWLIGADGGGLRQFTVGGGGGPRPVMTQYSPSISPDGRSVAYIGSEERSGTTWRNLFVKPIGVRDTKLAGHPVLAHPTRRAISSVTFAPGARRLVFSAVPANGGDLELFSVGTDGRGRRQLTRNDIQDIEPTVSVTGRIAYGRLLESGTPERALFGHSNLALLVPGHSAPRPLTRGPNEDRDPDFAPSGRNLVFERYSRGGSGAGAILRLDLASRRSQTILAGERNGSTFDDPHSPAVSPSGAEIVFDRTLSDEFGQISNPGLYKVSASGRRLSRLLEPVEAYDTDPSWGTRPR
jgi:Tol biopolymer transport system component